MATSIVIPQGTYPIGTFNFGPAPIPSSVSRAEIDLDGTNMTDPALHITLQLDLSVDGGVTWSTVSPGPSMVPFPITATMVGGALNRTGQPLSIYSLSANVPGVGSTARQVRGSVVISGAPLTTQGTLIIT